MNHQNFFLMSFVGAVMALTAGCDDSGGGGDTTGTGTGTGTGTNTGTGMGIKVTPDMGGFVAKDSNPLGIQGPWYSYADTVDCQKIHTGAGECSNVTAPAAGVFAPTADGKMCTEGTVAKVLDIPGMVGTPDYNGMWGAGIAFDFNNPGMGAAKGTFDAAAAGVTGMSFTIDTPPLAGLRIEIPDAMTAGKSAAYLDATDKYPNSMLTPGVNTFTWAEVKPPVTTIPALDTTKLSGIQFHVPTNTTSGGSYKFCISDITFLK
jgi:hypothetical protein